MADSARGPSRTAVLTAVARALHREEPRPWVIDDYLALGLAGREGAELREANRQWQAMVRARRSPGGARRHPLVLGPPESSRPLHFGDLACTARKWSCRSGPTCASRSRSAPGAHRRAPVLNE